MAKKHKNVPRHPGRRVLKFIRENYFLHREHGIITTNSRRASVRQEIGTKSNGSPVHDGYRRIRTQGKTLKFHHVVFFLDRGRWPRRQVGHLDGDKSNNRPHNLEEQTDAENQADRTKRLREKKARAKNGA